MAEPLKEITIIGAGVIGLTTGITLQEKDGYQVTIVAKIWPMDHPSPHYTMNFTLNPSFDRVGITAAGSEDHRQQKMDTETFRVFWKMSEPGHPAEKCFIRTSQHEHYFEDLSHPRGLETMPDFKLMLKSALLPGAKFGITFTAISFDPPAYLDYLSNRFLSAGRKLVHGSIHHIKQVVREAAPSSKVNLPPHPPRSSFAPDAARAPSATVILHAPWLKFSAIRRKIEDELLLYVIPRPNGNIVLGGTLNVDDWHAGTEFESSWGSASMAVELMEDALKAV
ncbi:hypothetical protein B0H11DRAFT_2305821 [Mycena galericulata]|nr:hypothetical protein B0H11DRAFT_2305821 [Mycena galericulata]